MLINKSIGVSPTEKLLARLCDNTFLSVWSYPNPFKADGKEVCDVIAVFENHVFLFFDRESKKFEDSEKDLNVQWERWQKDVIYAQIKTAVGAKRYIQERPKELYLDAKETIPFPIRIPTENVIIHSIIIGHGASEACKKDSANNVSGSLAVCYVSPGTEIPKVPFFVKLSNSDPVHVLDTSNLEIVLKELDTVADFTNYLSAKEQIIKKFNSVFYIGEEDLLAHYLANYNKITGRYEIDKTSQDTEIVFIKEGQWIRFSTSKEYKWKCEANSVSVFWDRMLKKSGQNTLEGRMFGNKQMYERDNPLMEMAAEPRISRRTLSEGFTRAMKAFVPADQGTARRITVVPSFYTGKIYVLLQIYSPDKDFEGEHRSERFELLEIACGVVKNKYPHLNKVIGIAMTPSQESKDQVNDYILINCSQWPEETFKYYEDLNKICNFLETKDTTKSYLSGKEFPVTKEFFKPSKIGRNEPCPCKSGSKFKNCCMNK